MSKDQPKKNQATHIPEDDTSEPKEKGNVFQRNPFLRQMSAMLNKNVVVQKRFVVGTMCEYLFPIILIFLSCVYVFLFQGVLDKEGTSYSKTPHIHHILQPFRILLLTLFCSHSLPWNKHYVHLQLAWVHWRMYYQRKRSQ